MLRKFFLIAKLYLHSLQKKSFPAFEGTAFFMKCHFSLYADRATDTTYHVML